MKKEKSFRAAPQRRDVKKEEDIALRRSVVARDPLFRFPGLQTIERKGYLIP